MSTNYYFENIASKVLTDKFNTKLAEATAELVSQFEQLGLERTEYRKVTDALYRLEREPLRLHIGKRSAGWKPLFAIQAEYTGIKGMQEWYEANKAEWIIVDECEKQITWDELTVELLEFNKNNPKALTHFNDMFDYEIIDGHEWVNGTFS